MNRINIAKEITLSSPWVIYYRKIRALFLEDPDIDISFIDDSDEPEVILRIETLDKADAISRLLPEEMKFGNVTLKITIIPPNPSTMEKKDLVKMAFRDNPAYAEMRTIVMPDGSEDYYALFIKEVVQYPSDSTSDFNGLTSTLYQNLAKELLGEEVNLHYCTCRINPNNGLKF